ncbi:respiratory nitrate reductase subunit gamma [Basilea psittacipulmonis]|uniref:nitrate reductase (quinone) n=1 Tax=Basilea psittacipulmonis DSM 24701 TaxID=1072685 RepID=A0A077DI50_9BURK|nr:respiratory nitrate reductase subunit gamma [Basilea psittacipulmonis]AIL32823.1 nitrate reductase [Basilea psittacipulmonis DSM 24701]
MNLFFFGIYPYICMSIFLLGSLVRYDREQYTWKSDSSQLLYRGQLILGSRLFHLGVLMVFLGHLFGLLTPLSVWEFLGVTHTAKQIFAMSMGGLFGSLAWIGLVILIHRRLRCERLRANSTWRDYLVLGWIFITLSFGLSTIFVSAHHLDGEEMVKLMEWAQHIVTFRVSASDYIQGTDIIFRIHIFLGMTFFAIFPFTRMVHAWSGFGTLYYIIRPWQLVRRR